MLEKPANPLEWSDTFARLTWRMMPEAAVPALKARATAPSLTTDQRKLALDSIAFIPSKASAEALMEIATTTPAMKAQAVWWLANRSEGEWSSYGLQDELENRGLVKKPVPLVEVMMPAKPSTSKYTVTEVLALKGDATRGKVTAGRCIMCHQIDGAGIDYGPALKGFGSRQAPEVVARAIVDPSFDISHGFDGKALTLKDSKVIHGRLIAEGDTLVIKSTGGLTQHVPKKQVAQNKPLNQSLMLSADQLGLNAQDVADIVEWMKVY